MAMAVRGGGVLPWTMRAAAAAACCQEVCRQLHAATTTTTTRDRGATSKLVLRVVLGGVAGTRSHAVCWLGVSWEARLTRRLVLLPGSRGAIVTWVLLVVASRWVLMPSLAGGTSEGAG